MNLLSNAGTQSLQGFYSSSGGGWLGTISTKNTSTNKYCGFATSSIFSNSSGLSESSGTYGASFGSLSGSQYSGSYRLGNDGKNYNGPVNPYLTKLTAIPTSSSDYASSKYGSSLMGNYTTSLQHVALGQYAPTSVFEQRLNYHLPLSQQNRPGQLYGNTSNYFNVDSVAYNQSATSNYNVFGTSVSRQLASSGSANKGFGAGASSADTVSKLMSCLSINA